MLAVVSDKVIPQYSTSTITAFTADLIQATDYSPFGAPLAGRTWSIAEEQSKVLIASQAFTSGTDSWATTGTGNSLSNVSGKLQFSSSNTAGGSASKDYTTEVGAKYRLAAFDLSLFFYCCF